MGKAKNKLELTWIGKENRAKLEPRILVEEQDRSYHAPHRVREDDLFDNRLVYGDNLLALKSLQQEFSGKIKCIYVDPPFNTGQAFDYYDDGVEHSLWLSLMSERFSLLYDLLSADGLFWIHLDDTEVHYCKVVLDELFGRSNFLSHITYERSGSAGLGQGGVFVNTSEHILFYKKGRMQLEDVKATVLLEKKTMQRYNKVLLNEGTPELVREFASASNGLPVRVYKHSGFEIQTISLSSFSKRESEIREQYERQFDRIFRTNNVQKENRFQNDLMSQMDKSHLYTVAYTPSRGKFKDQPTTLYYYNSELFAWLKDTAFIQDGAVVKTNKLTDVWVHSDIPKADLANEGGVDFPRGKKPEQLLRRIIQLSTRPGDWVLDSFAGSGTTGAVAHKMGRRWIMVELGEQCKTHIVPRMKSVIDGNDPGGVTKAVGWKGGGGFRYFRLGPTLIVNDEWGNPVINPDFNAAMLAEAMCKLEGFTFDPDPDTYWQQGYSSETDFIYVTTQFMSNEMLTKMSEDVGPNRSLLICCSAFRADVNRYDNLNVKKIPKAVLRKCEWGHDDYSLEVANLPDAPADADDEQLDQPLFDFSDETGGK